MLSYLSVAVVFFSRQIGLHRFWHIYAHENTKVICRRAVFGFSFTFFRATIAAAFHIFSFVAFVMLHSLGTKYTRFCYTLHTHRWELWKSEKKPHKKQSKVCLHWICFYSIISVSSKFCCSNQLVEWNVNLFSQTTKYSLHVSGVDRRKKHILFPFGKQHEGVWIHGGGVT